MPDETRRTVLKSIGATCAALSLPASKLAGLDSDKVIRLGVIADLHAGLADDAESRLDAFLDAMSNRNCDALIQMGDFAFPNAKYQAYADKFNAAHDHTIHVIGNHEFDFGLTREDCFKAWGIEAAYYVRELGDLRLLVLDGNEAGSPDYKNGYPSYIGNKQKKWLAGQLDSTDKPILILSHQPLAGVAAIDNAVEIQQLLAKHKDKIVLCINGHSHVDSLLQVDGVNYLHINSASYYWVGGETKIVNYKAPLFTSITIDPASQMVSVEGKSSSWRNISPNSIGYFDADDAPPETSVVPEIRSRQIAVQENQFQTKSRAANDPSLTATSQLKFMTWNIWGKLNQDPRYTLNNKTARERTIEIILKSGADIVAMIETYGSAADIADALGFFHYTPSADANLCIFSRFPLSDFEPLDGLSSFSFIAATATLPDGQKIRIYDIWLTSSGRHIVDIKNKTISDQEFCDGDDVRFEQLEQFLEHPDLRRHLAKADEVPVVVAGDFNCVSHLDHTVGSRHCKLNHSRVLPNKVSKAMYKAGFLDSYRESNPDVLESSLGHTWTTVGMGFVYEQGKGFVPVDKNPQPEYRDPYARIDYIYSLGMGIQAVGSTVIKHHPMQPARSFPEFPSDHAAVLTEFRIKKKEHKPTSK